MTDPILTKAAVDIWQKILDFVADESKRIFENYLDERKERKVTKIRLANITLDVLNFAALYNYEMVIPFQYLDKLTDDLKFKDRKLGDSFDAFCERWQFVSSQAQMIGDGHLSEEGEFYTNQSRMRGWRDARALSDKIKETLYKWKE
jgi:hypothetical protein